jgi:hypothetical protein
VFAQQLKSGRPVGRVWWWRCEVQGQKGMIDGGFLGVGNAFLGLRLRMWRCVGCGGREEDGVAVSVCVRRI